jgi:hypothetical protein
VGLKRGLLSLVSTIEELFERKSNGSGLESREYGRRDKFSDKRLWLRRIVRSRNEAMEFFCFICHGTHHILMLSLRNLQVIEPRQQS